MLVRDIDATNLLDWFHFGLLDFYYLFEGISDFNITYWVEIYFIRFLLF